MTTPKLREGAHSLLLNMSKEAQKDHAELLSIVRNGIGQFTQIDTERTLFLTGAYWALNNLHKLLEPINWGETHADAHKIVDSIIDKRVAIVELEND